MKKRTIFLIIIGLYTNFAPIPSAQMGLIFKTNEKHKVSQKQTVKMPKHSTEWQLFVKALIKVESNGDPHALGTKNDAGIFQITPIYVQEVNRIQTDREYTLNDRYDVKKSMEMFNIMNDYYNKEHNINKAIRIHNPNADDKYRAKIRKTMEEISRQEIEEVA